MISEEAKAKCRRLMEVRQARDDAKAALKVAEDEYREMEVEVYEDLESLRDPNDPSAKRSAIKVPLGPPWGTVSFCQRETTFGRIYDEDAALEYFEQRGMVDEISSPKFVKRRINEIVRDAREQGLDMPPGVDYYPARGVTITRPKTS